MTFSKVPCSAADPTTSPTIATTTTGAQLPLVALPETELLTVNETDTPWLADSLGQGIRLKPLRLDIEAGVWVILVAFAPGSSVPLHHQTGEAEVFTLSGRWHDREYPDQPQTAGSYLYERRAGRCTPSRSRPTTPGTR